MYNEEELNAHLNFLRENYYASMESAKLVKRNKVPFVEHLTIVNDKEVVLPPKAEVHDDLKRELVFYNLTLENAKKGIEYLL